MHFDSNALLQSLELTLIGMIVICAFMGLLIVIVHFLIAFAVRFMPDREEEETAGADDRSEDGKVIAAIAAALHRKEEK